MANRGTFESLEPRQLFASVTLLAPTWDGGIGGWVQTDANDITARMGGPSAVPNYTLTIAPDANGNLQVTGVTRAAGTPTPQNSAASNIVVIIDYTAVSQNPDYPLSQVGALVANYMTTTPVDGVRWAELPIHEIDLSRSCDLMDAISYSLGQAGVWVDQETYMDPHPISSIGDAPPTLYDNVAFADDYWRTSGEPEQGVAYNGEPVAGAYNQELPEVQNENDGFPDAHVAVAGYYTGTIDFNSTWDGDGPVYADWYGNTPDQPARQDTGFYYSAFVGGTRPLDGVWAASGGTGTRTATGQVGQQWPNITDVNAGNNNSVMSGANLPVNFLQEDRGQNSSVSFFLDSDQNPYNGSLAALGSESLSTSASIDSTQFTGSTTGVTPGTYWIMARVSDGNGLYRYTCGQQVTITAPMRVSVAAHSTTPLVTGKTAKLDAAAIDANGGADVTYTWSTVRTPAGAPTPIFSANGTVAAQDVRATFAKDGTYVFRSTMKDANGDVTFSDTEVVVSQTPSALDVSNRNARVKKGKKVTFGTTVVDQFGHAMRLQPRATYAVVKGTAAGSVTTTSGVFTASSSHQGPVLIKIEEDDLIAMVSADVIA